MSRSGLLLLRMNCSSRLFFYVAVDKEAYAKQNERYAEPLSHIQYHILLEHHLRFLDEFDKESHSEATDEECSDEETAIEFIELILIHQYLEYSEEEIAERFIELSRMFRLGLASELENESPRE